MIQDRLEFLESMVPRVLLAFRAHPDLLDTMVPKAHLVLVVIMVVGDPLVFLHLEDCPSVLTRNQNLQLHLVFMLQRTLQKLNQT